jgi:DNA-binding transcriptional ArsR family regulator
MHPGAVVERNGTELAQLAGLLSDGTRAAFCLALMDGRAWTAGELARAAGVAPSTTTSHLARLVAAGFVIEERHGRHCYVRLAGPHIAELVEILAVHTGPPEPSARSLRAVTASRHLADARTCYDHLAGRLGVRLTEAMVHKGWIDDTAGFSLTPAGLAWLDDLGVDTGAILAGRRSPARMCLDWTERRPHLAGASGAALCQHYLDQGWLRRMTGQRAVRLTGAGVIGLAAMFGIDPADLSLQPV